MPRLTLIVALTLLAAAVSVPRSYLRTARAAGALEDYEADNEGAEAANNEGAVEGASDEEAVDEEAFDEEAVDEEAADDEAAAEDDSFDDAAGAARFSSADAGVPVPELTVLVLSQNMGNVPPAFMGTAGGRSVQGVDEPAKASRAAGRLLEAKGVDFANKPPPDVIAISTQEDGAHVTPGFLVPVVRALDYLIKKRAAGAAAPEAADAAEPAPAAEKGVDESAVGVEAADQHLTISGYTMVSHASWTQSEEKGLMSVAAVFSAEMEYQQQQVVFIRTELKDKGISFTAGANNPRKRSLGEGAKKWVGSKAFVGTTLHVTTGAGAKDKVDLQLVTAHMPVDKSDSADFAFGLDLRVSGLMKIREKMEAARTAPDTPALLVLTGDTNFRVQNGPAAWSYEQLQNLITTDFASAAALPAHGSDEALKTAQKNFLKTLREPATPDYFTCRFFEHREAAELDKFDEQAYSDCRNGLGDYAYPAVPIGAPADPARGWSEKAHHKSNDKYDAKAAFKAAAALDKAAKKTHAEAAAAAKKAKQPPPQPPKPNRPSAAAPSDANPKNEHDLARRNACGTLNKGYSPFGYCDRILYGTIPPAGAGSPIDYPATYHFYKSVPLLHESDHNAVVALITFNMATAASHGERVAQAAIAAKKP